MTTPPMIPPDIQEEITRELRTIEKTDECRVLLAVESGSRAWGFPSRDSDYDVRFVYIRPIAWYLSVDSDLKRDVIERPISDDLDISGWDIKKALLLFAKSNPSLLEWLASPIVYMEAFDFAPLLRAQMSTYYSSTSSFYHYLHMAQTNFREYLKNDVVWLKKYLYALRPLLVMRWIEQERGVAPMEFARLLVTVEDQPELVGDIQSLVDRKLAGDELDRGPTIPTISTFIVGELQRFGEYKHSERIEKQGFDPLNNLFLEMLQHAWG